MDSSTQELTPFKISATFGFVKRIQSSGQSFAEAQKHISAAKQALARQQGPKKTEAAQKTRWRRFPPCLYQAIAPHQP